MPARVDVPTERKTVKPALRAVQRRLMVRLPLHVDAIQEHANGTYVVHCAIYGRMACIPSSAFEELCLTGSEYEDAEDDDPREVDDAPEEDDHAGEEFGI